MKLRGYFHPVHEPVIVGLTKEGGAFWLELVTNDESDTDGAIRIALTVPSEEFGGKFAHFTVHYDGLKIMRRLEEIGFLGIFEEIQASTFYDVVQCFARCDIPVIYHGGDVDELQSRKMYELLHPTN